VRGADAQGAAVADVGALGALADDDEVDLAGVDQGRRDARPDRRRSQVDVVVEREAQLQQQAALDDAALQPRVARVAADRAQQDRVVRRQGREVVVGEDVAGLEVPVRNGVTSKEASSPAATSSTLSASATTSGPMPSPGTAARRTVRDMGLLGSGRDG
jgi:hypothetical protein